MCDAVNCLDVLVAVAHIVRAQDILFVIYVKERVKSLDED
jgi:hypothetical protein